MCTGKKNTELTAGGCRGKCADLAQAKTPQAELQKQQQQCHGTADDPAGSTDGANTGCK